jgi:hypothetical protein
MGGGLTMRMVNVRRAMRRVMGGAVGGAVAVWCLSASAQMQLPGAFAVNESGAATYTIPLNLPPGVGGVEPKLEFVYNSQRGDGPLGVGWALSGLSAITRCPQTLAQDGVRGAVNYDGNDRYCIDGQRLMVVSGSYGVKGAAYRTEIESYRRVVQTGPATDGDPTGPVTFTVTTKDGLTMSYGGTDDSRVQSTGRTTHLAWLLNSVQDRVGNRYDIVYVKEVANGVGYPSRIDYTANTATGLKAASSVLFDYEARVVSTVSPPFAFHAGSKVGRYILRLAKVRTTTDAVARAVLEYRLGYGLSPSTGRSRIESVTLCTAAGQCLPATSFTFAAPEAAVRLTNSAVPSSATANGGQTLMGDFNGDGRTDLLFSNTNLGSTPVLYANGDGTWREVVVSPLMGLNCCFNSGTGAPNDLSKSTQLEGDFSGDGRQDIAAVLRAQKTLGGIVAYSANLHLHRAVGETSWVSKTTQLDFGSAFFEKMQIHVGDFDGDGRADLLFRSDGASEFYVMFSNGDGTWRRVKSIAPAGTNDWINNKESTVLVGDYNGDGKHDLAISRNGFTTKPIFFSKGDGTWTTTNAATPDWANSTAAAPIALVLGDFNGDGKTDMILLGGSADPLSIIYAKGNGEWQPVVSTLTQEAQQAKATGHCSVGDFNGDGRHDLVYGCGPGSTTLTWFYSLGEGNWRISTTSRPDVSLAAGRRLIGDFNGDGIADVALRATGAATIPLLFGRTDNGERLTTITQGNGAVTEVQIASLVQSGAYTCCKTLAAPYVATTPAMRVVYRTQEPGIGNGISKTVGYSYDSAIVELGTGRGFAGFGTVSARDDDLDTVTATKYRYEWPYTGRVYSHIVLQGTSDAGQSPAIVSSTAVQFTCQNPVTAPATVLPGAGAAVFAPGQAGDCTVAPGARYQVWASRTFESHQDLSRARLPGSQTNVSDMDKFGNPGRVQVDTLNPDGAASGHTKITDTWYSNDEVNWLLGLPIRRTVTVTKP